MRDRAADKLRGQYGRRQKERTTSLTAAWAWPGASARILLATCTWSVPTSYNTNLSEGIEEHARDESRHQDSEVPEPRGAVPAALRQWKSVTANNAEICPAETCMRGIHRYQAHGHTTTDDQKANFRAQGIRGAILPSAGFVGLAQHAFCKRSRDKLK